MKSPIYLKNGIELDSRFWSCECQFSYVHRKSIKFCATCQTSQEGQPDARASEVRVFYPDQKAA